MAGRSTKRTTARGETIPTDVLDDVLDAERAKVRKDQGLGPEFDDAARELREKMRLRDSQRLFEWRANEADAKDFDRESFRKRVKDIVGKGDAPSDPPPALAAEDEARGEPPPAAPHRTTTVADDRQRLVRWAALAVGLAAIVGMLIAKLVTMPSAAVPSPAPAAGDTTRAETTAASTAPPTSAPTATADANPSPSSEPAVAPTSAAAKTSATTEPPPRPSPTLTSPPPKPTTAPSGPGLIFTSRP